MPQGQHLIQEQRLQQRLTPLQVQYVRMLEMTGPEVEDTIARALDENPALTTHDQPVSASEETAEQLTRADYQGDDDGDEAPAWRLEAPRTTPSQKADYADADEEETLTQHLEQQLSTLQLSERQEAIARWVIASADDNGYLRRNPRQLADELALDRLPDVQTVEVEQVIAHLQQALDPAGVLAADLRQCLELQLQRLPRDAVLLDVAKRIIARYYEPFVKKQYPRLMASLHVTAEQLQQALDVILSLNPKPGAGFWHQRLDEASQYIIPDVSAEVHPEGQITITLASQTPELAVEDTFNLDEDALRQLKPEARAFIHTRAEEARNIIRLVKMRNDTLMRVTRAIATVQKRFFTTEDTEDIVPMGLKDIAAMTGLDMSVVSRATSTKYIALPGGIYPMKMFFSLKVEQAPSGENGEEATSHNIIAALRRVIAGEDPSHPLSDEALAKAMSTEQSLPIARRTVAKYRERLGIPPARLRRGLTPSHDDSQSQ